MSKAIALINVSDAGLIAAARGMIVSGCAMALILAGTAFPI
ncbi:MAG: hypothetical protein WAT93_14385 [Pontixanthobacter sp.]